MMPPHHLAVFCLLAVLSGHVVQVVVANNAISPIAQVSQQIASDINKQAAAISKTFSSGQLGLLNNASIRIGQAMAEEWSTMGRTFQVTNSVLARALQDQVLAQNNTLVTITDTFNKLQDAMRKELQNTVLRNINGTTITIVNTIADQNNQLNKAGAAGANSMIDTLLRLYDPIGNLVYSMQQLSGAFGNVANSGVNYGNQLKSAVNSAGSAVANTVANVATNAANTASSTANTALDVTSQLVQANINTLNYLYKAINGTQAIFAQQPALAANVRSFGNLVNSLAGSATALSKNLPAFGNNAQALISAFGF